MGRLMRRLGCGELHDLVDGHLVERPDPRRSRLVAKKAVDAFGGKALLPSPNAGFGLLCPLHDLDGAVTVGRKKDDVGSPGMLLRGVAVTNDRLEARAVSGGKSEGDSGAHAPDSHVLSPAGIPLRIR